MNKFFYLIGGFFIGCLITFSVLYIIGASQSVNENIILFEEPSDDLDISSFKVLQVIENSSALVKYPHGVDGPIYLLTNNEGYVYYDDQVINLSDNEVVCPVGIFHYKTKGGLSKTVPIIKIFKK